MNYDNWKKREDDLDELYPNRKRGVWRFDYIGAGVTLGLLIGGMAACVYQYHGNFDWLLF